MQSSIQYRPRSFSEMIGQEQTIKGLRGLYKAKRFPQTLLFTGPKGSGKTTIARIIALSLQCTHQKKFGEPCKRCRLKKATLPIYELNCAKVRGVDEVEAFVAKSEYDIVGHGRSKVFILDEMHRLSPHAQDVFLGPFEKNDKNKWIITSNKEQKIHDTLRSRAQVFNMRVLSRDLIAELVSRLLIKLKSELSADDLADALIDNGIVSGRLIANAVDKYYSGMSAEDAAQVDGVAAIQGKALVRAAVKGHWPDVSQLLKKSSIGDVALLRASVIGYLHTMLLDSTTVDDRSTAYAEAIKKLAYVTNADSSNQLAALASELFTVCKLLRDYSS